MRFSFRVAGGKDFLYGKTGLYFFREGAMMGAVNWALWSEIDAKNIQAEF